MAVRFFNTHHIKCNPQKHPFVTNVKQWKGRPVKIYPLALVKAMTHQYCRIRDKDLANSDDGNSEDGVDNSLVNVDTFKLYMKIVT